MYVEIIITVNYWKHKIKSIYAVCSIMWLFMTLNLLVPHLFARVRFFLRASNFFLRKFEQRAPAPPLLSYAALPYRPVLSP